MKPGLSAGEKQEVVKAAYRQIFERDITRAYSQSISYLESQVKNGDISMKEFVRRLGKSPLYRKQFYEPFINSRVIELAFRHFLGRGPSSREEVQEYFSIISKGGLAALVDALVDSQEFSDYFGEETVPYIRGLGQEAQECRNWGAQQDLLNYSAPFRKVPQFITLFADYERPLPDQHPYGSGNDPLEIQFGAIFPNETRNPSTRPAPFGKDTKRILIHQGPGINNQNSNPGARGEFPGSLGPKVFRLDQLPGTRGRKSPTGASVKFSESSTQAVIKAAYLQVFGRDVYEGQRLKVAEIKLENGEITVREFIRALAKSDLFRKLYWTSLYVTKAIEYIHRRLLGRPTYGRQDNNKYFDICAKKGFYALVDALIDSPEYSETFGEDTVPYRRFPTLPAANFPNTEKLYNQLTKQNDDLVVPSFEPVQSSMATEKMPMTAKAIADMAAKARQVDRSKPLFIELGRSFNDGRGQSVEVGVGTTRRKPTRIYRVTQGTNSTETKLAVDAIYCQVMDLFSGQVPEGLRRTDLDSKLKNGEISVREFVRSLASSDIYRRRFYTPYPNTKVIEFLFRHLLGRAPATQGEIRQYNKLLAEGGLKAAVDTMVNSPEYAQYFGEDVVPYQRFPSLPAGNYLGSVKAAADLVKQSWSDISPSSVAQSFSQR
jgi:phycobilisome core-membrane linker protein